MASTAAVLNIIVSAQTGQATAALARVDKQLKGTAASGAASKGALERLGITGSTVAAGGVAAVAYGLYKSIRVGMDFEKQMSSLEAVTNSSGAQMEKFKQQAISAAQGTIFGAREVAQAQTELAKGGLRVKDILGGALPAALDLAAAGELDLAQAATTTVNAMKLFGLRGNQAGQVADMLATAANTTTAEVSDFAMALTQGGSAAKQVGYSLNDTVVVLEALAEAGIKNSDAGTSMKTALLQLAAPTTRQRELTRQLGLEFFNQAGEMKNPIQLAGELEDALGEMSKAQRTATLKTLAGTDGFRTLASLYDLGAKKARRLAEENKKVGTAADTAGDKTDNLAGDLESLKGRLEGVGIKLYEKIKPGLRITVQGLEQFSVSAEKAVGDFDPLKAISTSLSTGAGMTDFARNLGNDLGTRFSESFIHGTQKPMDSFGQALANKLTPGVDKANAKLNALAGRKVSTRLSLSGSKEVVSQLARVSAQAARLGSTRRVVKILGDSKNAQEALTRIQEYRNKLKDKKIKVTADPGNSESRVASLGREIASLHDKTVTVTTNYRTVGAGRPGGRAGGGHNIGPEMAIVNERGPELARFSNGSWGMLAGGKRNALVGIPSGTDIFTASETRKLLAAGIPGYAKGKKKPKAKPQGNRWEAALAAAELTSGTADDIAALGDLIRYWQRQAKKYSKPVKMAGKRGKAMNWSELTNARQQIKNYTDQLADLTGTGAGGTAGNTEQMAALQAMLNDANLRYAVSQAQYKVLKSTPYAGSFASGGVVPGPIGQPQVAVVHGGESIMPTGGGRMEFVITNWQQGTGYLRSIAGQEVDKAGRSASRGVNRTPGNAGALV